jgi:hypothetical protein
MLRPYQAYLLCALLAVTAGCKPKVGDDCRISADCSAAADRLCDITAPGGYCTVFNCEPNSCPEDESLCVQFGARRSPIAVCEDKNSPSPYARTFCMATCDSDSDCRSDYVCQDVSKDNDWGAVLIDRGRGTRACLAKSTLLPVPDSDEPGFGDACVASQGGAGG